MGRLGTEVAHGHKAARAELAGTSCLLPGGQRSLRRFSVKLLSPISKTPVVFLPCPLPRAVCSGHLMPSANGAINYWGRAWTQPALGGHHAQSEGCPRHGDRAQR